jgi:hypothetical protein
MQFSAAFSGIQPNSTKIPLDSAGFRWIPLDSAGFR